MFYFNFHYSLVTLFLTEYQYRVVEIVEFDWDYEPIKVRSP